MASMQSLQTAEERLPALPEVKASAPALRNNAAYATHLGLDVLSAFGASFMVSPFITIVDRSIIQNASGVMQMGDSIRAGIKELVMRPHVFLRRPEFLMIFGVYSATYTTANAVNTTCEHRKVDSAWPRFLSTSAVNMTSCIAKDRAFTRMFGSSAPMALPLSTYALFTIRDAGTVGASFNLPGPVSEWLQAQGMSKARADFTAQMACPAAVQFLSTPLHLIGLDLYNNPKSTARDRWTFMCSKYTSSVAARIGRIGPAFGIGGVGNTAFRKGLRARFAKDA
ncbi:hypothetical protein JKP88DRAFT_220970 [Tribonema minus]|uniref:Sequence orphan n=1 Tax=Tribonema minus TaxID=303371 RepID=A0A835Z5G8_9STRA|nr:hypothetical protein JKP88DRAFT_220970 [Tribonema minus]|eukprot:TRINITY_DN3026_c0_g1_i2.p1 TRINITY_DN3026_c0_g1~~TRINITY_DN3026_c0_g1_i2.p1  ORF type:complete len:282 (+),score=58.59 TRINITY_DN3026_c0_g1_i2:1931-2776(+)